jgi:hypothetical protein
VSVDDVDGSRLMVDVRNANELLIAYRVALRVNTRRRCIPLCINHEPSTANGGL